MIRYRKLSIAFIFFLGIGLLALFNACQSDPDENSPIRSLAQATDTYTSIGVIVDGTATVDPVNTRIIPPATSTAKPTSTPSPEPSVTPSPMFTPTATPIGPCSDRLPAEDNFTLVTLEYGLSREYVPRDLVDISDFLPQSVTLGYPSQVRETVIDPLVRMIDDMIEAGLEPQIVSAYRSYSAQLIAWNRWLDEYPDRAAIVSAPPGHSEHQLGTTIDFGSPELAEIIGNDEIRFHTDFYKTREGQWLDQNAHKYGFTLSFSRSSFEQAGLFYEPWHFRYVGFELATFLKEHDITLIQYLLEHHGPPCIP